LPVRLPSPPRCTLGEPIEAPQRAPPRAPPDFRSRPVRRQPPPARGSTASGRGVRLDCLSLDAPRVSNCSPPRRACARRSAGRAHSSLWRANGHPGRSSHVPTTKTGIASRSSERTTRACCVPRSSVTSVRCCCFRSVLSSTSDVLDPDVALFGMSFPDEQDAALAAVSRARRSRGTNARRCAGGQPKPSRGKGICWWNPADSPDAKRGKP
jgi:hypothetical protein